MYYLHILLDRSCRQRHRLDIEAFISEQLQHLAESAQQNARLWANVLTGYRRAARRYSERPGRSHQVEYYGITWVDLTRSSTTTERKGLGRWVRGKARLWRKRLGMIWQQVVIVVQAHFSFTSVGETDSSEAELVGGNAEQDLEEYIRFLRRKYSLP